MIQLQSVDQLQKAIERAKASKLFVHAGSFFRQYKVTNRKTGAQYTVDFFLRNGKRFGHCTCKAGKHNKECKHIAAAAGLHIMRAAQATLP